MLLLTRDEAIGVLNRVLAVPITRSTREIPTHVHLDESDGMPVTCALALDNLGPIAKGHLTRRITTLGPERMNAVCRALSAATDC
jgi:mRNA-degrading endonuclease toxin of MazEF toxin-antitoxin module